MSDCGVPDGAGVPGGGGTGHSGDTEGQDPTVELPPQTFTCSYGGDVPDGVNGTDTENWTS
jgi:hypothetical protein